MRRGETETPILFVAELRRRRRRRKRRQEEPIICVRQRVLLLSVRAAARAMESRLHTQGGVGADEVATNTGCTAAPACD